MTLFAPFLFALLSGSLQSETKIPVTLHYGDPSAQQVQYAGDLKGWDAPQNMTRYAREWATTLSLPADTRFEYKLIVDKKWMLDPSNPKKMDNSFGDFNSVYEGPGYHPNFDEGDPKTPLTRSTLQVGGREIIIFAPAHPQGLPILTYADGPAYEKYGKVQNVVENLVEAHRIKPVVIALVPPLDRMKEYGAEWEPYAKYLLNDVLPAVRKSTGASDKAKDLYVGGSSLGGVIALRLAEEFPDKVAGGVHSQSGAFQYHPVNVNYTELITPKALGKIAKSTRLWFDWGNFEDGLTTTNQEAVVTLQIFKRPFGYKVTNEGHNWTAWRNRMVDGLVYLLGSEGAR